MSDDLSRHRGYPAPLSVVLIVYHEESPLAGALVDSGSGVQLEGLIPEAPG